jgi:C-terminal processing protease CtpA/Prc
MNRKIILILCLFAATAVFNSCLVNNDALPAEHTISEKKAKEDFKTFTGILKKAHPALYAYTPQQVFERFTDSLYKSISGSLSQRALYNMLSLVVEKISCSHTNVYLPAASVDAMNKLKYFFPYPVIVVDNKLLVNISGKELPRGTEIKAINNVPVPEILRSLAMYNSTDGMRNALRRRLVAGDFGYEYFLKYGPQNMFMTDCIKPDSGARQSVEAVMPVTLEELNSRYRDEKYYYDATDVDYDFYRETDAGYAVMKIRTFEYSTYSKDRAFENFCENTFTLLRQSPGIKTLVIDIRENSGGNYSNCHLLFSYLAAKPFHEYERVSTKVKQLPQEDLLEDDYGDISGDDLHNLVNEEFYKATNGKYYLADSVNELISPKLQRFAGTVFVVVNGEVNSAASYFASLVKNSGRGKIIGEETRGGAYMHNGFSNVVYKLPNSKIEFAFSVANVVHSFADKKDYGKGVVPDYIKPSTLEDFKKNEDSQLNFILDSLIKNNTQ